MDEVDLRKLLRGRQSLSSDAPNVLDLSALPRLAPLKDLDLPFAKVRKLPEGVDWSQIRRLRINWHPCWVPLLRLPTLTWLEITHATQEALDATKPVLETFMLHRPRLAEDATWFAPDFASEVVIQDAKTVHFGNARDLSGLPRLSLRRIGAVHGLDLASRRGSIPKLSLCDVKDVQPEGTIWDIRVDQGVVLGDKRTSRWLYDAWPHRPEDWRRWHFSPLIAKDLDPERIDDPLPFL